MKVKSAMIRQTESSLYQSLGYEMVDRISQMVIPGYSLHRASGIPDNIPITAQMAARQLVLDAIKTGRYLQLVETMISIDLKGFMGREHPIYGLTELLKSILAEGYGYDRSTGLFMENTKDTITPNWGRLVDGEEWQFAVLRLDIVQNSAIVRENAKAKVDGAYALLRAVVQKSIIARQGRVWSWEGDGCLAGFLLGRKERAAILAGMDILHELWLFNQLENPLDAPIQVRIACHTGLIKYSPNPGQLKKSETVREVTEIEGKFTEPDSIATTKNMILSVDRMIQDRFTGEVKGNGQKFKQYSITIEKA